MALGASDATRAVVPGYAAPMSQPEVGVRMASWADADALEHAVLHVFPLSGQTVVPRAPGAARAGR